MKVLLTLVASTPGLSGVQRHALNLAECLLEREGIEVHVVVAPWQRRLVYDYESRHPRLRLHIATVPRNVVGRNTWFYFNLPRLADEIQADLVHATYPIPVMKGGLRVPLVVTLHDLYPFEVPENFGRVKAALHRSVVRRCFAYADAITCVSEATACAVPRYLPSSAAAKTTVIYNCVTSSNAEGTAPDELLGCSRFLFTIAQHRHNKNIPLLLRALQGLLGSGLIAEPISLVIVGMRGPETRRIKSLIVTLGLSDNVFLLEGISEEELQWCYRHCSAVVIPSTTEGFCLPVAEALLAGCPIVCSDIPVLREIAGERCTFVALGPGSEVRFSQAIAAAIQSPRPAPINLPRFSKQRISDQYFSLYQRLTASCSEVAATNLDPVVTTPTSGGA